MKLTPISYVTDPTRYFACLRDLRAPVLLDSGGSSGGRYDIIAADPEVLLTREGNSNRRLARDGSTGTFTQPVFEQIRDELHHVFTDEIAPSPDWPFLGGAIGMLGYEALHGGRHLPRRALPLLLPDVHVGIYDWAVMLDHQRERAVLMTRARVGEHQRNALLERLASPAESPDTDEFQLTAAFEPAISREQYDDAFRQVIDYIHAGDCYQVNLTQRLSASCNGDSLTAYRLLRERMRSPFSAYLETGRGDLLCLSPERLLEVRDRHVETRPIKGTLARSRDPVIDQQLADELHNSTKDRAENLMIVDLLRNDLAKHAATGSVRVEKLFGLESYANVHHLVSVIQAKLADGVTSVDMLRGCFPGGSITGAPKLRARQIIDEVEPNLRSAYCGSMFYASACGNLDSNINIRSVVRCGDEMHVWGGGGIVADSDCDTEYRESLTKIRPIVKVLEGI